MRILITNYTLAGRSGTETFVRDLALGLLAQGHQPIVYAPVLGGLADELRSAAVPVLDDLRNLAEPPDLIHGQHQHETMTALLHFPETPGIFVVHDRLSWHDQAPCLPQVRRYVAVDQNRRDRLASEQGIAPALISVIPNAVDTRRFQPRAELPERPRRALLFSNYVRRPQDFRQVLEACAMHGVDLQVVGAGVGPASASPDLLLPGFDLVFGLGRSAMEAMATGTGVVLWGLEGLGGLVRPSNFEELLRHNFGRGALHRTDAREIAEAIQGFDRREAEWVRDHVRSRCNLDFMVTSYLEVYQEALREARERPVPLAATLEAASRYLAECVPKAQVDALLEKRVSRGARRIRRSADGALILCGLALTQLDFDLVPLVRAPHVWLRLGLAVCSLAMLGWLVYVRSWLHDHAESIARMLARLRLTARA